MVSFTKDSTNALGEAFRIYDNKIARFASNLTINGNLDVGSSQAQTSIKAYVNQAGYQGNIQIEARWRSEGFIHFNTNYSLGYMFLVVKDSLYQYCGNNTAYLYNHSPNHQMTDLKKTK